MDIYLEMLSFFFSLYYLYVERISTIHVLLVVAKSRRACYSS